MIQNVPAIATLNAADAIGTLAALGFLGYGIQPTEAAEWGYDLQRAIDDAGAGIWWTGLFPGLAIVLLVTGFTLVGEGINDTLNPLGSMWQPRVGVSWDVSGNGQSVLRGSAGIYFARQNMLSQVGSVTTNGLQQQTIFLNTRNHRVRGAGAGLARACHAHAAAGGPVPPVQRGPRLRPRLQESSHLRVQRRLRAAARTRTGRRTPTSSATGAAT